MCEVFHLGTHPTQATPEHTMKWKGGREAQLLARNPVSVAVYKGFPSFPGHRGPSVLSPAPGKEKLWEGKMPFIFFMASQLAVPQVLCPNICYSKNEVFNAAYLMRQDLSSLHVEH